MPEKIRLAPCAGCGSITMRDVHEVHKKNGQTWWQVRCECGQKTRPLLDKQNAVALWNRRWDKRVAAGKFDVSARGVAR